MSLSLFNSEDDSVSHFALIMLGVIVLIILYGYIGNFLEHKHVLAPPLRSMSSTKQESA